MSLLYVGLCLQSILKVCLKLVCLKLLLKQFLVKICLFIFGTNSGFLKAHVLVVFSLTNNSIVNYNNDLYLIYKLSAVTISYFFLVFCHQMAFSLFVKMNRQR